jgi:hypothetical protein
MVRVTFEPLLVRRDAGGHASTVGRRRPARIREDCDHGFGKPRNRRALGAYRRRQLFDARGARAASRVSPAGRVLTPSIAGPPVTAPSAFDAAAQQLGEAIWLRRLGRLRELEQQANEAQRVVEGAERAR